MRRMNPTPMAMATRAIPETRSPARARGRRISAMSILATTPQSTPPYELVRCKYLHSSVVESHDGPALSAQCTTHGFGQSGVERDRLGRLDILVPVLEEPDDPVAFAPGENELTGLAEALELLVRLDDLAQRGCGRSSWNVFRAELGIEARNRLDDARPALDHFLQAGAVHAESRFVQHVDGDRGRRQRDRRHDPDREEKDARALSHEFSGCSTRRDGLTTCPRAPGTWSPWRCTASPW